MSKSKEPVDPDLIPKSDEHEQEPQDEEQPHEEQAYAEGEPQEEQAYAEGEQEQAYAEDEQAYAEGEQEQAYAEDEHAYAEGEQGPVYDDHEAAQFDAHAQAYETAPMTGPPHMLQHMQQMQPQMHMPPQPMMQPQMPPPQGYQQQQPPQMHGGPYRIPPYDPNAFIPARGVPIPRPLLGSAIAVYGVLLWSFVIAGQFATSWISGAPMDQGLAAFIILACTVTAWVVAARRSRAALPTTTTSKFVGRCIGMGAIAFGAFLFTILIATMIGEASSGSGHDFLIAFLLVGIATAASAFGPRLTHPLRPAPSHGMRFAVVLVWIAGAIATFVAGAELATSG